MRPRIDGGMGMKKGFSLVELLIVLAVIASIIAISTPLALNAMRKARAAAVASDFKTLSRAISSSMYLGDGIPSSIDSLGRNVSSDYGVAWSDNGGVYDFVIFTNKEVDTSILYTLLTKTGAGFPAGEYEFLPGGAANSENSKAYYHVYLDGSGGQTVSSGLNLSFANLNQLPFLYSTGDWITQSNGLASAFGVFDSKNNRESQNRAILNVGDDNWTWEDYEIVVSLSFTDRYRIGETRARGYAVYFRATGRNAGDNLSSYAFQFDPGYTYESVSVPSFLLRKVSGYGESLVASSPFIPGIMANDRIVKSGEHTIRIVARGSDFTFYFNGTRVLEASNGDLTNGKVGLRTWGNVEVVFKNVTVRPL